MKITLKNLCCERGWCTLTFKMAYLHCGLLTKKSNNNNKITNIFINHTQNFQNFKVRGKLATLVLKERELCCEREWCNLT